MSRIITESMIKEFTCYLYSDEKSKHTVEKYLSDIRAFSKLMGTKEITKSLVLEYKIK